MDWQRDTAWHRLDERGNERSVFICGAEVCVVEGIGVLAFNGSGMVFEYHLEFEPDWNFSSGMIAARVGDDEHSRTLERRADGDWYIDGARADQFSGFEDIDLSFSPSTNTATIKRLALQPGQEAQSRAVWVSEPTLKASPLLQTYRRTAKDLHEYVVDGQQTPIQVDSDDLVIDYAGHFKASAAVGHTG